MAEIIEIKIEGLDKLNKKLGGLNNVMVREQMRRTMYISTEKVKNEARKRVPVDTGNLRRSIRDIVQVSDKEVSGIVGPTEPYGAPVEYGSKLHFPPVGALKRWAEKRGINPYALAVSISRKGTKPHPFLIPAFQEKAKEIVEEFKNAIDYLLNQ